MRFMPTGLPGAWLIEPEARGDERGFLARTFCVREFAEQGLHPVWVQCSTVYNAHAGTLRGMHFQSAPHAEAKLIRCTAGAVYDVIVDLRPASPTYRQWFAAELTAANRHMVYVPEGFAHGMQTLVDGAELFYMMSTFYEPSAAAGVRWDDPALAIHWPPPPNGQRIIGERDKLWPTLPL